MAVIVFSDCAAGTTFLVHTAAHFLLRADRILMMKLHIFSCLHVSRHIWARVCLFIRLLRTPVAVCTLPGLPHKQYIKIKSQPASVWNRITGGKDRPGWRKKKRHEQENRNKNASVSFCKSKLEGRRMSQQEGNWFFSNHQRGFKDLLDLTSLDLRH